MGRNHMKVSKSQMISIRYHMLEIFNCHNLGDLAALGTAAAGKAIW